MKKILSAIFALTILLFTSSSYAGEINNIYDARNKIEKITELSQYDFDSLINKGELIGLRYNNFRIQTEQYKTSVQIAADNLTSMLNQAEIIQNSLDYSESDKIAMVQKLYLDMDTNLYNLDSLTLNYIISMRFVIPILSYEKFVKKFRSYYNSLGITASDFNPGI